MNNGTAVDRSRQTVAEMMRYWLETYARHNVRAKTFEDYVGTITRHIVPALGTIPVQRLTPDQLQTYYSEKLAAGCGKRTVETCHMRLSQALDQAVKLGIVMRNVADAVTPPRVEPKEMRVWNQEQGRQFLAVAGQSTYGPIWIVAMATGMRRSELLGLRWEDVDCERGVLCVRQVVTVVQGAPHAGPPKSKSSRRDVLVPEEVMDTLREHKRRQNEQRLALGSIWEDHDLVFAAANGNYINPNNLTRDFMRLVALAGLPTIRIHDLRHAHVALLIQLGADIKDVSERVGHARTSTTMDIYHHVMPEQRSATVEKLRAALFYQADQPTSSSQMP